MLRDFSVLWMRNSTWGFGRVVVGVAAALGALVRCFVFARVTLLGTIALLVGGWVLRGGGVRLRGLRGR